MADSDFANKTINYFQYFDKFKIKQLPCHINWIIKHRILEQKNPPKVNNWDSDPNVCFPSAKHLFCPIS